MGLDLNHQFMRQNKNDFFWVGFFSSVKLRFNFLIRRINQTEKEKKSAREIM